MRAEALWTIDACTNALADILESLENGELTCASASSIVNKVWDQEELLGSESAALHLRELQESKEQFCAKLRQVQNELSRRRGDGPENKAAPTEALLRQSEPAAPGGRGDQRPGPSAAR